MTVVEPTNLDTTHADVDVVVVGAGFAGLYALHRLRDELNLSVRVFEAGSDVGGTWYWNRYPGVRCDIESIHYSYSFNEKLQQEWEWTERFAGGDEILRYLNHVADRFDLRTGITFNTRVVGVQWDDKDSLWTVRTDDGLSVRSRFFISGAGTLSVPKSAAADFPGIEAFRGEVLLTARWPHADVDFTGKRVAVIGTGSSGIQIIPKIAEQAAELTVFQRTPNYAVPIVNRPADPAEAAEVKRNYQSLREHCRESFLGVPYDDAQPSALAVDPQERRDLFDKRWDEGGWALLLNSYQDVMFDEAACETVSAYVRDRIAQRVHDPDKAEKLMPRDHLYGQKRPPLETDYYEAYNRDSVHIVDVRETPIRGFAANGIEAGGRVHEVDIIVLATGFDAFTGPLMAMDIRGRNGVRLADAWVDGPHTYLGLMSNGFPNLFMVTGPQSPSVQYNMPLAIEDHVDFIADAIAHLNVQGLNVMEPTKTAETAWGKRTAELASMSLVSKGTSWWMGSNVPGKPRVCLLYLGGAPDYRQFCAEVVNDGYAGFELTAAGAVAAQI
jgi:cyclohexanone monooxygenase